ncbi:hypothetical protein QW71_13585 [Paenibacillus sp. IHB B 3415]|nr:hypothetical protein QW71_13585 [Paenibacillus sp. IHB B 3415]
MKEAECVAIIHVIFQGMVDMPWMNPIDLQLRSLNIQNIPGGWIFRYTAFFKEVRKGRGLQIQGL